MVTPRRKRPELPGDEVARRLLLPKPQFLDKPRTGMDTSGLPHRKIHPDRDESYLRWLRFQDCAIKGRNGHECWSPDSMPRRQLSDAAHTGKAFSGRLKQSDRGCIPLCRFAHDEQERNMDAFDRKYGIDRFAVAAEHYARFRQD